jgi:hypothetical protein
MDRLAEAEHDGWMEHREKNRRHRGGGGLLVVRHETRGRAAGINRGVQEATAPITDTLLPDDAGSPTPCCPTTRL